MYYYLFFYGRAEHSETSDNMGQTEMDVVVKIADHSETSDNMGQGMAEQAPGKWLTE